MPAGRPTARRVFPSHPEVFDDPRDLAFADIPAVGERASQSLTVGQELPTTGRCRWCQRRRYRIAEQLHFPRQRRQPETGVCPARWSAMDVGNASLANRSAAQSTAFAPDGNPEIRPLLTASDFLRSPAFLREPTMMVSLAKAFVADSSGPAGRTSGTCGTRQSLADNNGSVAGAGGGAQTVQGPAFRVWRAAPSGSSCAREVPADAEHEHADDGDANSEHDATITYEHRFSQSRMTCECGARCTGTSAWVSAGSRATAQRALPATRVAAEPPQSRQINRRHRARRNSATGGRCHGIDSGERGCRQTPERSGQPCARLERFTRGWLADSSR